MALTDVIEPDASSMNKESLGSSWNPCLAPAKKNGGVEPEEELEMREGIRLMRGAVVRVTAQYLLSTRGLVVRGGVGGGVGSMVHCKSCSNS